MEEETKKYIEDMERWGLTIKARKNFYSFLDALKSENDVVKECQKVYKVIDDIVLGTEREQFTEYIPEGTILYRARVIRPEDDTDPDSGVGITSNRKFVGFNEVNSAEPIIGKGGDGRNNIAGMPYLYLSVEPETACVEIKSQLGELISLAEFQVKRKLEIIDLSTDKTFSRYGSEIHNMSLGVFFTMLMMRFCEPVRDIQEYRATQIIADYIRKSGVDGIAYKSYLKPAGKNYTIFHSHRNFIQFCGSRVLIHKQMNHSFWDFNNEKAIFSNPDGKLMEYDSRISEIHRRHLSQYFSKVEV